jgi:hypothetical protein
MTRPAAPAAPGIDTSAVEDLYRQLLKALGQDPDSMLTRGARAVGARASTQTLLGTVAADVGVGVERRLHATALPGNGGS